jgi:tight adherence protein C
MNGYQLIAAVIAFIACYLAIGRIWQVDPLERRQLRQTFQRYGGLSGQQLGLKGPRLRQWLGAAGFLSPNAPMYYAAIVISMVLVGATFGMLAATWAGLDIFGLIALGLAGGFMASKVPSSYIGNKWVTRSDEIADAMPLMLDMLDVCATAGLSVDDSWSAVERQMPGISPALSEEMQLVKLEVRLGKSRELALREMAERSGVGDAAVLASMLTQSERFGAGLADTFRAQSDSMRQDYNRSMEERAHLAGMKTILPVTLLMLPAMLLVTVFPLVIVLLRAFFTEI